MRGEYSTRQKREMLAFLKQNDLKNFTVDDLVFKMEEQGEKIGRSTAYRYLEQLAEQGSVRKYQNARGVTQYQHVADNAACDGHFHMMCRACGKLMHVNCNLMDGLAKHIFTDHGFRLDPRETVLMGICAHCTDAQEETEHGADHTHGCHHCL
ncbi:MAG: transcriptional repressor [Clostridia bacterium]|nr:transcriptional repressor [Clostridia bacterium]